jgi:putative acetyltransferase
MDAPEIAETDLSEAEAEAGAGLRDEIMTLYRQAFPDEDLTGLVAELLALGPEVLSMTARSATGALIGHGCFSICGVERREVALLGPLAVTPARQKSGVGGALVRAGLDRLRARGVGQVLVLGDPVYYGRFGFRRETQIDAPYTLPADWGPAWQSLLLIPETGGAAGRLRVPGPWRKAIYWAP